MNTEVQLNSNIRYRLHAQNRENILIIEVIGTTLFISRTAQEIISDQNLIQGFSQEEADLIGYIAETSGINN